MVTRPPVFADGLLFSFVNVCDVLGIEGEALRARVWKRSR